MDTSLPRWLRRPLLGSYVWLFGCNMHEAKEEKLEDYESFAALFTRELKRDARPITSRNQLVCGVGLEYIPACQSGWFPLSNITTTLPCPGTALMLLQGQQGACCALTVSALLVAP